MAAQKVWLPNFPTACFGEKFGLKLLKPIYKMLSLLFFMKLVLTLQPVLEAGVFELCVLWSGVAGAGQDFLLLHWTHHL